MKGLFAVKDLDSTTNLFIAPIRVLKSQRREELGVMLFIVDFQRGRVMDITLFREHVKDLGEILATLSKAKEAEGRGG